MRMLGHKEGANLSKLADGHWLLPWLPWWAKVTTKMVDHFEFPMYFHLCGGALKGESTGPQLCLTSVRSLLKWSARECLMGAQRVLAAGTSQRPRASALTGPWHGVHWNTPLTSLPCGWSMPCAEARAHGHVGWGTGWADSAPCGCSPSQAVQMERRSCSALMNLLCHEGCATINALCRWASKVYPSTWLGAMSPCCPLHVQEEEVTWRNIVK